MKAEQNVKMIIYHAGGEPVILNCTLDYAEKVARMAQDDAWLELNHGDNLISFAPRAITAMTIKATP